MVVSNILLEEFIELEGVIIFEILGIQYSELIFVQKIFFVDDQQFVEKMEVIVSEESFVFQEIMEVGDIAELANLVIVIFSDNNNVD